MPDLVVYGALDLECCPRVASISFNLHGLDHGLVAAILNDHYNIAVRNECFCAHPYVKEMIMDDLVDFADEFDDDDLERAVFLRSGMVRASFGLYSTADDVTALVEALTEITDNREHFKALYVIDSVCTYVRRADAPVPANDFSVTRFVDGYLAGLG